MLLDVVEEQCEREEEDQQSVSIAGGYTDSYTENERGRATKEKARRGVNRTRHIKRMALEKKKWTEAIWMRDVWSTQSRIESSIPNKYFFRQTESKKWWEGLLTRV